MLDSGPRFPEISAQKHSEINCSKFCVFLGRNLGPETSISGSKVQAQGPAIPKCLVKQEILNAWKFGKFDVGPKESDWIRLGFAYSLPIKRGTPIDSANLILDDNAQISTYGNASSLALKMGLAQYVLPEGRPNLFNIQADP